MAITDIADGGGLTDTIWQTVIDTVEDTSSGHDHDGTDSKQISYTDVSGIPWKLMHSDKGSTTSSLAEVDTHTFSADDFADDDVCIVIAEAQHDDGSAAGADLRISMDGTDLDSVTNQKYVMLTTRIISNLKGTSNLTAFQMAEQEAGTNPTHSITFGGTHSLSGAWTIALDCGDNSGSDTIYWRWRVYKLVYP